MVPFLYRPVIKYLKNQSEKIILQISSVHISQPPVPFHCPSRKSSFNVCLWEIQPHSLWYSLVFRIAPSSSSGLAHQSRIFGFISKSIGEFRDRVTLMAKNITFWIIIIATRMFSIFPSSAASRRLWYWHVYTEWTSRRGLSNQSFTVVYHFSGFPLSRDKHYWLGLSKELGSRRFICTSTILFVA